MMRAAVFALFALFALPALAQDDTAGKGPTVPRTVTSDAPQTPSRAKFAHPMRVVSTPIRTAAIQAPPPTPRPPAASSSGKLSQSAAQQNPAQVLQQFTLTDLQAALADAQAQNPPDTVAANCYQELINVVQSPAINPLPSGPGAFQLFQKARDLKALADSLQSRNGPLAQLNVACAPLVMDVQTLLIRLGVIGGAVAGGL